MDRSGTRSPFTAALILSGQAGEKKKGKKGESDALAREGEP